MHSEIPEGWKLVRLGDVVSLRRKKVIPTNRDEYRYVGLEHIISGGSLKSCGKANATVSAKTMFFPGDTLYGKLRPNLRKVTRIDFEGVCSTDILVMSARPCTDSLFASHLIRSNPLYEYAMRGITGTRMPRTSWDHLKMFPFLLPPLPEQRAIAVVLGSIDETIEQTEVVITATERLRDAVRHELLTRGLPGWHTEWKKVPRFGTVPADWEVVRVGEVAKVNPRRPRLDVKYSTQITFLPMAAIAKNCAGILSRRRRAYGEISRGYTYFEENDVLFAKITPCLQNGKHALATGLTREFGFGTTEFHVIRAGSLIKPAYLFRVLTRPTNIDRCKSQFRGTAGQQRVHPETLRSLPMLLPPLVEQRAIAAVLASIDDAIEASRRRQDALSQLKESAAEALLTGQRQVPWKMGGHVDQKAK